MSDDYLDVFDEDDTQDLHEDTEMDMLVCPCCMEFSMSQKDMDEQQRGFLCTRCNQHVWMGE